MASQRFFRLVLLGSRLNLSIVAMSGDKGVAVAVCRSNSTLVTGGVSAGVVFFLAGVVFFLPVDLAGVDFFPRVERAGVTSFTLLLSEDDREMSDD